MDGITQKDAFIDLGIMRLGARIYDLKKQGYNIISEVEQSKNRFGENTYYKKYMLAEDKFIQDNERHFA